MVNCDEVGESGTAVWYTCCAHCWMGWKKCIDKRRQSVARLCRLVEALEQASAALALI